LCWYSNNQRGLSGSTAIPNPSANAGNTPKPNINRQFPLEANEASMIWARRMPTVNGKLVQGDEAAAQFGRRYFTDVEWRGVGCDADRDPSRDQDSDARSYGTQNRSNGKNACSAKDRALASNHVSESSAQSRATNCPHQSRTHQEFFGQRR
jgi:hypothetical protein